MPTKEKSGVRCPKSGVNIIRRSRGNLGLRTILLAAFLLAASVARGDSARKPTLEAIGNEVQCTCGCVAPLSQCPMVECAEKAEMRAFIKKEIADGKDETAILQDISIRYGVQALTAPPAEGFNLAVWILPGIGLLAGLGIVVVIVCRWRRKPAIVPAPTSASLDPKVLTAVEEEMKSTGMG
ncbi:MAG TPA: cytochrome c-type biogenesis protein CcmH [Terriglobia bacterium]|nr:cytochrome c-type biogenesis protein CcmH [Terriglobia bacterium]